MAICLLRSSIAGLPSLPLHQDGDSAQLCRKAVCFRRKGDHRPFRREGGQNLLRGGFSKSGELLPLRQSGAVRNLLLYPKESGGDTEECEPFPSFAGSGAFPARLRLSVRHRARQIQRRGFGLLGGFEMVRPHGDFLLRGRRFIRRRTKSMDKNKKRPTVDELNDVVTVKETAEFLGVTTRMISGLVSKSKIKSFKIGGKRLILKQDILEMIGYSEELAVEQNALTEQAKAMQEGRGEEYWPETKIPVASQKSRPEMGA